MISISSSVKAEKLVMLTLWRGTAILDMKGFLEKQDFIKQKKGKPLASSLCEETAERLPR